MPVKHDEAAPRIPTHPPLPVGVGEAGLKAKAQRGALVQRRGLRRIGAVQLHAQARGLHADRALPVGLRLPVHGRRPGLQVGNSATTRAADVKPRGAAQTVMAVAGIIAPPEAAAQRQEEAGLVVAGLIGGVAQRARGDDLAKAPVDPGEDGCAPAVRGVGVLILRSCRDREPVRQIDPGIAAQAPARIGQAGRIGQVGEVVAIIVQPEIERRIAGVRPVRPSGKGKCDGPVCRAEAAIAGREFTLQDTAPDRPGAAAAQRLEVGRHGQTAGHRQAGMDTPCPHRAQDRPVEVIAESGRVRVSGKAGRPDHFVQARGQERDIGGQGEAVDFMAAQIILDHDGHGVGSVGQRNVAQVNRAGPGREPVDQGTVDIDFDRGGPLQKKGAVAGRADIPGGLQRAVIGFVGQAQQVEHALVSRQLRGEVAG